MHITNLHGESMPVAQKVQAQRPRRRKVHTRSSRRNVVVREQHAATQLEVRFKTPTSREVPFQSQGIKACPVRRVVALEDHKDGYGVQGVFKSSLEKSGTIRPGQYPAITQAHSPNAGIRCAPGYRVSATRP